MENKGFLGGRSVGWCGATVTLWNTNRKLVGKMTFLAILIVYNIIKFQSLFKRKFHSNPKRKRFRKGIILDQTFAKGLKFQSLF